VLEFKPKWLCQSPSAPKSSSRCRNCARSVLNGLETGRTLTTAPFCPLDLLLCRTDDDALNRVMQKFANNLKTPLFYEPLKHWFRTNTLLQRLANHQHNLDNRGPLFFDVEDDDVLRAMTLRDCACFLRISLGDNVTVEAKLGDLDLKNGVAKKGQWLSMEQMLRDKGCYTETEEPRQHTRCSLGKI
jgi:inositol-pentakisphosphate 2-kinase